MISKVAVIPLICFVFFCVNSNATKASDNPKLSLVIDDLGYSLINGKEAFNLPGEHTYAIIPNSVYAEKLSVIALKRKKELIMHLPMQAGSHNNLHEANTLNDSMSEEKLIKTTQSFLDSMPYISGINNHMGSHLTQFAFFMRPVMDTIYKHNPNLYFLDSRTSAESKAFDVALSSGLKAAKRTVFLDHSEVPSEIRYQFNHWLRKARKGFSAVAIAHPTQSTLEIIRPLLKENLNKYQFVPLSNYLPYKSLIDLKSKNQTQVSLLNKKSKL